MSKKLILLLATCLLTTSCLFGCGDDTKPSDATTTAKVETTTKDDVATTEPTTAEPTTPPETTTQEPTTEEPSTEYVYKGEKFMVESTNKDCLVDLVVEKGHKFKLNDLVSENVSDSVRGTIAKNLVTALFMKNHHEKIAEFENTYWEAGLSALEISYDKNVVIEYNEEEKLIFHLVEDNGKKAYFDVYEIE